MTDSERSSAAGRNRNEIMPSTTTRGLRRPEECSDRAIPIAKSSKSGRRSNVQIPRSLEAASSRNVREGARSTRTSGDHSITTALLLRRHHERRTEKRQHPPPIHDPNPEKQREGAGDSRR